tara:strand:- start:145 stop:258 length:114 start_codon:yes stop_codon:yes gene_type:complete
MIFYKEKIATNIKSPEKLLSLKALRHLLGSCVLNKFT